MEPYLLVSFAGLAFTLIAVPGPDWAFILAAGARHHVVLPAVAGLVIGYALITGALAIGIASVVTALPWALPALTVCGAAYLIHLGLMTLRNSTGDIGSLARKTELAGRPWRFTLRGVGVSVLNPKGLLIFVALLPQFTRSDAAWPVALQLLALGGVFIAICGAFYVGLGLAADRVLGARPRLARATTRVAGAAMVVLGVALVVERLAGSASPA